MSDLALEHNPWVGHDLGMVLDAPADLILGPVHEFWHCRHNGIYLHRTPVLTLLVIGFIHKDHVTLVGFSVLVLPARLR